MNASSIYSSGAKKKIKVELGSKLMHYSEDRVSCFCA